MSHLAPDAPVAAASAANGRAASGGDARPEPALPRTLLAAWTEFDMASGTPVILCDTLSHFPPDAACGCCEENRTLTRRRQVDFQHAIHKFRWPYWLWPLRRGARVREALANLSWPLLVGQLLGLIRRHRPEVILAVYFRTRWILATWLASRLSGVPVVYWVHDAYLPNFARRGPLARWFARQVERRTLGNSLILTLHPHLVEHYAQAYGANARVVRQMARFEAFPPALEGPAPGPVVIGFSGAIYENNYRELAQLAALVAERPALELRIWTDAPPERLAAWGIAGSRVHVGYESDQRRLLERLRDCSLLYLPLAFEDGQQLTRAALAHAFPTKSIDYLAVGRPILVHAPEEYELSRFFQHDRCGHLLNAGTPAALAEWFDAWLAGRVPPVEPAARQAALDRFSVARNRRDLAEALQAAIGRRSAGSHRA